MRRYDEKLSPGLQMQIVAAFSTVAAIGIVGMTIVSYLERDACEKAFSGSLAVPGVAAVLDNTPR